MSTILQSSLLTDFLYPFLLIFFICFGILEKTSILGSDKKQLNAMLSLVIGLVFVGAVFPKIIAANLVQFMTVGMVVIFVAILLWNFVSQGSGFASEGGTKIHKLFVWLIGLGLFFGVLWATGIAEGFVNGLQKVFLFLFDSSWSGGFWTNTLFVIFIALAIALVLGWNPFKGGMNWYMKLK